MNETPSIVAGPGSRAGEYVLDEKIGQGAFGEVWKAHHRAWTDQFAAVKIPTDPEYLRQLQGEGFTLHRLAHPNVVRVIGFDPGANPPYLMTELVNGPSLRKLLGEERLTVARGVAICRQILTGLAYAHQRGIIHGDLKPENVLIEQDALAGGLETPGTVKLTDFGVGLAAVTTATGTTGSSRLQRNDRSGAVGTFAYIAPEQREGLPPDARCDLFACGVMLFEVLTGERPAGAESPSELNPDVPKVLDEIFRRAYARRDRRYTSAEEFAAALADVAKILGSTQRAPEPIAAPAVPPAESDIIGLRPDDEQPLVLELAPIVIDEPPAAAAPVPAAQVPSPSELPQALESPAPAQPKPVGKVARPVIVIDEMARRPVRTAAELRTLFRKLYLTREMDQGEIGNLRLRLDQWAETVGGLPGFGEQVEVTEALDCPFHRVVVQTRFQSEDDPSAMVEGAVVLANPAASQDCGQTIHPDDFSLVIHLSTGGIFPPTVLEMIGVPAIRAAVSNLIASAKTQALGRPVAQQELKLARATVLSIRYRFEAADHGVCFAGNELTVVTPVTPVTKMRDDLLKRAASLLDTENIGAGINELRRMFQTPNPALPRAERMLVALRAKLSAAYLALARSTASNMGVFESLTYCLRAEDLLPGNPACAEHVVRVSKLSFWIQALPGILIGLVFGVIAAMNQVSWYGFAAAAVGAAAAGIFAWHQLRNRPARTDVAFCHGCLLPLALASVLAIGLTRLKPTPAAVFCVILVAAVLYTDRFIFRKYEYWLLRPLYHQGLGGTPLDILNQIQETLEPDWEKLRPYYVALDPLYKHASAQIEETAALDELELTETPADPLD